MLKSAATLLAAALSAAVALPAAAAAGREEASISVSHADLDLTSEAGQRTLDRRLKSAARQVCDFAAGRSLATTQEAARCYRQARRQAQVEFAGIMSDRAQRGG